jgi:hypothetical protein
MKKIAASFVCLSFLFCASVCSAAYLIHLKDGREITTHEYWEEGDQIKFKRCGGIIGIKKDRIREIEEIEDLPEENETGKPPEVADTKQKKTEQSRSIYECWTAKKALKVKLNAAMEKVREASKNRDFARKKEMIEELRKINKEIQRLTDEVKRMNNGKLPDFWLED